MKIETIYKYYNFEKPQELIERLYYICRLGKIKLVSDLNTYLLYHIDEWDSDCGDFENFKEEYIQDFNKTNYLFDFGSFYFNVRYFYDRHGNIHDYYRHSQLDVEGLDCIILYEDGHLEIKRK